MSKGSSPASVRTPTKPKPEPERWAALDIGSDTIHLLIATIVRDHSGDPAIRQISQSSTMLELGREVAKSGRISAKSETTLAKTISTMAATAHAAGARLLVGATEAMREAVNGSAVLERLGAAAGVPIHLLSGRREAQLGFLGVRSELSANGAQLLIDSGGASTEVSLTSGRDLIASVSLPVGAANLVANISGDPGRPLPWAMVAFHLAGPIARVPVGKPVRAFATGGTAHNLVGLEGRRKGHPPSVSLNFGDLDRLSTDLLRHKTARLAHRSGVEAARVKLLLPGALILAALLDHYGLDAVTIEPAGVRDGMILAAQASVDAWWLEAPEPARGSAVRATGPAQSSRTTRSLRASPASAKPSPKL